MSGLKKQHRQTIDFSSFGIQTIKLNLHKGTDFSVELPITGAVLHSSNTKVVSVTNKAKGVSVKALVPGESVLTATFMGQTLPVQVNVKVW